MRWWLSRPELNVVPPAASDEVPELVFDTPSRPALTESGNSDNATVANTSIFPDTAGGFDLAQIYDLLNGSECEGVTQGNEMGMPKRMGAHSA